MVNEDYIYLDEQVRRLEVLQRNVNPWINYETIKTWADAYDAHSENMSRLISDD